MCHGLLKTTVPVEIYRVCGSPAEKVKPPPLGAAAEAILPRSFPATTTGGTP